LKKSSIRQIDISFRGTRGEKVLFPATAALAPGAIFSSRTSLLKAFLTAAKTRSFVRAFGSDGSGFDVDCFVVCELVLVLGKELVVVWT
jgi:hypothetical protein